MKLPRLFPRLGSAFVVGLLFGGAFPALSAARTTEEIATEFRPSLVNFQGRLADSDRYQLAQTFTVQERGGLGSIDLFLSRSGPFLPSFVGVHIRPTLPSGAPTDYRGATSLQPNILPDNASPEFLHVDFSWAEMTLEPDVPYAVSILITQGGVAWHGTETGVGATPGAEIPASLGYAGGSAWESSDGGTTWTPLTDHDFGFQVRFIPEPGATPLLLLGAACLSTAAARRRSTRQPSRSPVEDRSSNQSY